MTAQDLVEGLLSINPKIEPLLRAIHVIAEPDRLWTANAHPEYTFLKYFFDPHIITIISKQIHVYIIGDKDKGNRYHIINLEGYHADHLIINKNELTRLIKETVSEKLFLPNNFYDRIVYMHDEGLFIFNRVTSLHLNMFTSKSKWTVGADTIYNVDYESTISERNTNAYEILKEIYNEF